MNKLGRFLNHEISLLIPNKDIHDLFIRWGLNHNLELEMIDKDIKSRSKDNFRTYVVKVLPSSNFFIGMWFYDVHDLEDIKNKSDFVVLEIKDFVVELEAVKPPLGLKARWQWLEERQAAIIEALERRIEHRKQTYKYTEIPLDWITELRNVTEEIQERTAARNGIPKQMLGEE